MLQPENNNNNTNNNTCSNYMPCAKFITASVISVGTCVFGCVMLGLGPTATLAPFYSSLISGSILYWVRAPSIRDDEKN